MVDSSLPMVDLSFVPVAVLCDITLTCSPGSTLTTSMLFPLLVLTCKVLVDAFFLLVSPSLGDFYWPLSFFCCLSFSSCMALPCSSQSFLSHSYSVVCLLHHLSNASILCFSSCHSQHVVHFFCICLPSVRSECNLTRFMIFPTHCQN